jgi:flagellar motor switch protein FliN
VNMNDTVAINNLLSSMPELEEPVREGEEVSATPAPRARRDLSQMMRKIPVTLTLEVGSARVTLQDLMDIGPESVVDLDAPAGQPLVIKVNGTPIGRAEVVVSGENYGLKVLDLDGLDIDTLSA